MSADGSTEGVSDLAGRRPWHGGGVGTLVAPPTLSKAARPPFLTAPVATDRATWVAIPSHVVVLDDLTSWIVDPLTSTQGGGLAVVTGEPGSGQTSLLTALAGSLAERPGLVVATVADDGNRRSDALLPRAMIAALGGVPVGRTGRELIAEVRTLMQAWLDAGQRPVILIDNAALGGSQLEIVRMLLLPAGDEPTAPGPLLVLFGPPELSDRIRRRRALAGMVERRHVLPPLDSPEIGALVDGLMAARPDGARSLFSGEAIAIVAAWSGGNLARVVRIAGECQREAIARNRREVDGTIARDIVSSLGDSGGAVPTDAMAADVVQTRLELGFPGPDPTAGMTGRAARSRRRR